MTRGQLTTVPQMLDFMLGGSATFTLESRSGQYYTYKVKQVPIRNDGSDKPPRRWFVSLLTGPDNREDYTYLGVMEQREGRTSFRLTQASKMPKDAAPVAGFAWTVRNIEAGNESRLSQMKFFHEGRCCRCNRKLTTPESISTGIGPVCAGRER